MQNLGMGIDPRAIANALLDCADRQGVSVSNLSLNKLIFFIHTDCMIEKKRRLSSLTFEAWQYGPVLPIIYHQFKVFRGQPITSRATKLDPLTGQNVVVAYAELEPDLDYIEERFCEYSRLSPSKLVALSHEPGGAWDVVWNGSVKSVGMKITDELILHYNSGSATRADDTHGTFH